MSVKIRLQRHGRKKSAFFHIVVADSRAPRNGKYIERLGNYNPNTNPATIELNFDSSVNWMQNGATPTDTCRAILSYKGVLMKHHLLNGVKKGAMTAEQAEEKFNNWLNDKTNKIETKKTSVTGEKQNKRLADLEREAKVSQERAAKIAAKNAPVVEEAPAEEAAAEEIASAETEGTVENTAEATTVEATTEEAATPEAENKTEGPAADDTTAEEPKEN